MPDQPTPIRNLVMPRLVSVGGEADFSVCLLNCRPFHTRVVTA